VQFRIQGMRSYALIWCITGCLLIGSVTGQAQALEKIDSLSKLLNRDTARDTLRVDRLNQTGFEYWTIDPAQSERYGHEALELAEELQYLRGQAMAHRVIGVSFWSRGDFYKALSSLFNSQKLYHAAADRLGEANAIMNVGLVYADEKDYGRALENFQYALQLFEKEGQQERVAITYNKIGTVYLEKGDRETARRYLEDAMAIHVRSNFSFGIMETANRMGLLARAEGNYREAESYLQQSLSLATNNKDQEHTIKNLENLASVAILQKKYALAKTYLDQAFPLAKSNRYLKALRDILFDYKNISVAQKNYADAFRYLEQYEAVKDSIFSLEKAAQVANLELEFQTAQQRQALKLREQEIELLKQQTRLESVIRLALIIGIVLLVTAAVLMIRFQRLRYRARQQLMARDHQLAKAELENARLRQEELQQSLEFKNKELASYTVNFIRKNELIENLKERLDSLKSTLPEQSRELHSLHTLIQHNTNIDRDWEDFKRTFENVHHNFFARLLEFQPDLTQSELRLCALICLNLSGKEMASLMGISPDSVKTARYRLRKKLNLEQDQNLTDFVIGFSRI
jgi:tetratricopeptide (TPR) repeat protein